MQEEINRRYEAHNICKNEKKVKKKYLGNLSLMEYKVIMSTKYL